MQGPTHTEHSVGYIMHHEENYAPFAPERVMNHDCTDLKQVGNAHAQIINANNYTLTARYWQHACMHVNPETTATNVCTPTDFVVVMSLDSAFCMPDQYFTKFLQRCVCLQNQPHLKAVSTIMLPCIRTTVKT